MDMISQIIRSSPSLHLFQLWKEPWVNHRNGRSSSMIALSSSDILSQLKELELNTVSEPLQQYRLQSNLSVRTVISISPVSRFLKRLLYSPLCIRRSIQKNKWIF